MVIDVLQYRVTQSGRIKKESVDESPEFFSGFVSGNDASKLSNAAFADSQCPERIDAVSSMIDRETKSELEVSCPYFCASIFFSD